MSSQKLASNEEKLKYYQLFQKIDDEIKTIKTEMMKCQASQSKLLTQLNENRMVFEEFKLLKDDSKVFKLVGPVLIQQEIDESRTIVEKRINFIQKELKKSEENLKQYSISHQEKEKKIQDIQQWFVVQQQKEQQQQQQK
eukprot:gene4032-7321_t